MIKHFIDLNQIPAKDLRDIINLAKDLKAEHKSGKKNNSLDGANIAMIFEKNSTRTRVSFEVAIKQLGGDAIVMNSKDTQLNKGETISDTAKVLSRMVDGIMIRANSHQTITELAKHSNVPIINALSDFSHPCQIIASILTIEEHLGSIKGKKLAWFGDQNNVLNSYIHAAKAFEYELAIASPNGNDFSSDQIKTAKDSGANVTVTNKPSVAASNADVLITDTWFSMGDVAENDESLKKDKISQMMPYQVNQSLMSQAKESAIFTHCLPAYRNYEVEDKVIDSNSSVAFDEAENRLHAQKAILVWLYK